MRLQRFLSNCPYIEAMKGAYNRMKITTKKIIVCLCAVLATAMIISGLAVGANLAIEKLANAPTVDEISSGKVDVENTNKDNSEESKVVSEEIPEVVKGAPIPGDTYNSMVDLYEKCSQSCVSVICTVEYEYNMGFYQETVESTSLGSGFVVEGIKDGIKGYYIITNHHVIEDAKTIDVKFYDSDEKYEATLIGSDSTTDIAVLTIEKEDLVPIEMGDSDALQVGQWVVAIGTPMDLELEGTMTYGIISGLDRALDITDDYGKVVKTMTVIQTSAEINPGNSGGPLINMAGQVIGINAMKSAEQAESLGFALPATKALDVINQIIVNGKVTDRGNSFVSSAAQLGISGQTITDELRSSYGLSDDAPDGVLILSVSRGTAVYEAGLSVYDIITEFDGEKVTSIEQLKEILAEHSAGDTVSMTYYRTGRKFGEKGGSVSCTIVLDGVTN